MTFSSEDKAALKSVAPFVTSILRHNRKTRWKLNSIIILSQRIRKETALIESATLPCKCGERHAIVRSHKNQSPKIHITNSPKLSPSCGPFCSMDDIAAFMESVRPELKQRRERAKAKVDTFHYEAEEPVDFLEWARTHTTKTYKRTDRVKAKRAHTVRHRAEGLTESERAIFEQRLLVDYPVAYWIHHKLGGTPDWMMEHRGDGDLEWVEGKLTTDRLEQTKQHDIIAAMDRRGLKVRIYPVRKVRDAA